MMPTVQYNLAACPCCGTPVGEPCACCTGDTPALLNMQLPNLVSQGGICDLCEAYALQTILLTQGFVPTSPYVSGFTAGDCSWAAEIFDECDVMGSPVEFRLAALFSFTSGGAGCNPFAVLEIAIAGTSPTFKLGCTLIGTGAVDCMAIDYVFTQDDVTHTDGSGSAGCARAASSPGTLQHFHVFV